MQLKQKFEAGEFAILAEFEPPKGVDVAEMVKNAKRLKGDIDAFLVPEMNKAVMRMSSLGGALLLQAVGLESIVQVNCRDRNRLALQADILAAGASGIPNIMAVAGEEPRFGDHHQARSVYDIDLMELLKVIGQMRNGRDMAGIELMGAPEFLVGSTLNAGARGRSVELEIEDMKQKKDAGAQFFITPPVFDAQEIQPFMKRVIPGEIQVVPTVLLLKSLGMARYITRNVGSIHIPDPIIERIQKAPDKTRECIQIAAETVQTFKKEGFSGVVLSTMGWENRIPEIIQKI